MRETPKQLADEAARLAVEIIEGRNAQTASYLAVAVLSIVMRSVLDEEHFEAGCCNIGDMLRESPKEALDVEFVPEH